LKIGSCLKHFSSFWRDVLGCTQYALEAVEGFPPHFTSPPPLSLPGADSCTPSQGKNDFYINQEVKALFLKGAIEVVPLLPLLPSYISSIFLVPKKSGRMRPILNLKRLNAVHLNTPYFRMEMAEDFRHTLRPRDWAASIDLRDTYFQVHLHEEIHELQVERPPYRFCVLPFGLCPAPKVFTALTKF
jgi:hypothetical protein